MKAMSIYDFLERLETDPWDPALTALFLGGDPNPGNDPEPQKEDTQ